MSNVIPAAPGTTVEINGVESLVVCWREDGHPILAPDGTTIEIIIPAFHNWLLLKMFSGYGEVFSDKHHIIAWRIVRSTLMCNDGKWIFMFIMSQ